MVALVVCGTVSLGSVVCWYGYKASVRIARWGRAMSELDEEVRMEFADFALVERGAPGTLAVNSPVPSSAEAAPEYAAPVAVSN